MPAQKLLGINLHVESQLLAQRSQSVHVALRLVAEVEVVAFVNFARVQRIRQHSVAKSCADIIDRSRVNGSTSTASTLVCSSSLQLDRQRREQLGGNIRPQNAQRDAARR